MIINQLNHIQFLRAISVLFVFFYHLKSNIFQNGYLGVDIFFFISGMVITLKLYENYQKKNRINIKEFFIKRIKRIYPVLIFFLTTTLLIIVVFSPLENIIFRFKTFILALLGLANLSYLMAKKDYFDNVFEDPLHHTWSLGVEEQFYLIYPFFLASCFFIFKKKISKIIITLAFLTIIGVYTAYQYSEHKVLIFYLPFFRFWQFLFGALIFFLLLKYKKENSLISLLFFFLIFVVLFSQNYFNEFSKLFFITFLSGFFLFFYNKNNFLNFLFNNKQFIYLGNISYSFYLWHLPVIYFYDLYFLNSLIRIPAVFILTLIVSSLSYKYVEQKFRYYKFNKVFIKRYIPLFGSLILIVLFSFYFFSLKQSHESNLKKNLKSLIFKFNYLEQTRNYSNRVSFFNHRINDNMVYNFCQEDSKNYNLNFLNLKNECLKNNTTKKIFYLEGNSHTVNFVTMFENSKFIENFYYSHVSNIKNNHLEMNKKINELSEQFDEFFYTTGVITHKELDLFQERIKGLNENIKILIIGPIPTFDESIEPLKCFIKKINCFFDTSSNIKNVETVNKRIRLLAESDKIFFYDPYNAICTNEICHVYNKKKDLLTHRDDSHLTIEGSKLLVPHFYNYYKNNLN
jgi:peptidoglycan/LPS O-acetylase OafA/YrhL